MAKLYVIKTPDNEPYIAMLSNTGAFHKSLQGAPAELIAIDDKNFLRLNTQYGESLSEMLTEFNKDTDNEI